MPGADRVPAWSERVYAGLLRLYPAAFREEYGGEMRAAFRRRWRDQRRERGRIGLLILWVHLLGDVLKTGPGLHREMLVQDVRFACRTFARRRER